MSSTIVFGRCVWQMNRNKEAGKMQNDERAKWMSGAGKEPQPHCPSFLTDLELATQFGPIRSSHGFGHRRKNFCRVAHAGMLAPCLACAILMDWRHWRHWRDGRKISKSVKREIGTDQQIMQIIMQTLKAQWWRTVQ